MSLLLMVLLMGAINSCISQNTTCTPDFDCNLAAALDKVPDPESCQRYYICVQVEGTIVASDSYFECPDSEHFDITLRECVHGDGPCWNACSNHCNMVCDSNSEGTRLAFPGEVNQYNLCIGNTPVKTLCPSVKPYFDGQDCVADESAVCDFCSHHCPETGIQVADPHDCRKFYICNDFGNPDWNLHGDCEPGQVFDPTIGGCVFGNDCNSICSSEQTTTTSPDPETTVDGNGCILKICPPELDTKIPIIKSI